MNEQLKRNMMEYLCQAHMSGQYNAGCMEPSYSEARAGVTQEYECVLLEIEKIELKAFNTLPVEQKEE